MLQEPQRNPKALENFLEAHREYEWEEICPPDCKKNHDKKWWGVTVPMPKKSKEQPKVKIPQYLEINFKGAPEPTRKDLMRHLSMFGDSSALHEVARLYGIDLKIRKERTA